MRGILAACRLPPAAEGGLSFLHAWITVTAEGSNKAKCLGMWGKEATQIMEVYFHPCQ